MSNESSPDVREEKRYILEGKKQNQQPPLGRIVSEDENSVTDDTKQLLLDDGPTRGTNGLGLASFNYINSIIGSGVIGIPYALHQAGFGLGLVLLGALAWITDYSLILMVRSGHLSGKFTYQGVMEAAFGRAGFLLLSMLQFVYPFIAMVSYNIVVGDTMTKVLVRISGMDPNSFFMHREFIVAMATIFLTLPLCLYKNIGKLAKISFTSLIMIAFILIAIIVRAKTLHDIVPQTEHAWRFANWDVIPAIGIIAFAFMCHHNTFLLYESILSADQRKWDTVTHASVLTSLVVSALFGIAGYVTFTGNSQGDLLENYCWEDDLMNVARVCFSLTILLTYPLECFVTRDVMENMIVCWRGVVENDVFANYRHYGFTVLIVASTYFISATTDCLGMVLELNGVLAAVPLAFVLPGLSYLKLEPGSVLSRRKFPALVLSVFGLLVTGIGLLLVFIDYQGNSCSHGKVMPYCMANWTAPLH